MLTSMSHYAIVPISIVFLGLLGKTKLAAGGLAISIFHVAGLSIITGLLTACETLFSQKLMLNKQYILIYEQDTKHFLKSENRRNYCHFNILLLSVLGTLHYHRTNSTSHKPATPGNKSAAAND
ncbi:hypothetical protein ACTXT7_000134 [Hymenolepis weldensis]